MLHITALLITASSANDALRSTWLLRSAPPSTIITQQRHEPRSAMPRARARAGASASIMARSRLARSMPRWRVASRHARAGALRHYCRWCVTPLCWCWCATAAMINTPQHAAQRSSYSYAGAARRCGASWRQDPNISIWIVFLYLILMYKDDNNPIIPLSHYPIIQLSNYSNESNESN